MSCNYAENLSPYENKGKLGLPEIFDDANNIERKCQMLADLLKNSQHTVVHTGAGISTSSGIPDFRGPNGVWTLEKKGEKPSKCISWNDAKPTKTHMAILALQRAGYVSYVVTQNIDGLHLRSGLSRRFISEVHGNMFTNKCDHCNRQFVRSEAVETVGFKSQGVNCPGFKHNGRRCRGKLFDTILDWEDSLPGEDLDLADMHSCIATLSLCLGTTLQIAPSGNLPVQTKRRGGNLVICNLQPTKQDRYANFIIHHYVDDVMTRVLKILGIPLPEYDTSIDPVSITGCLIHSKTNKMDEFTPIEWTINPKWVKDKELVSKSKDRKIIKIKSPTCNEKKLVSKKVKREDLEKNTKRKRLGAKVQNSLGNSEQVNAKLEPSEDNGDLLKFTLEHLEEKPKPMIISPKFENNQEPLNSALNKLEAKSEHLEVETERLKATPKHDVKPDYLETSPKQLLEPLHLKSNSEHLKMLSKQLESKPEQLIAKAEYLESKQEPAELICSQL